MIQELKYTIIIPVIHSLEDLSRCLKSLKQLDYPRNLYRVAIVDCNVVSGLDNFIDEYIAKQEYQFSFLKLPARPLKKPKWLKEQRSNEACNYAVKMIPAQFYIFTEDDCTFTADWLRKYEGALNDKIGALGGPDILPDGLGWFPKALDYILNSFLGTAGMRGKSGKTSEHYYPRRQNMVIPKKVIDTVGGFPEDILTGGELHLMHKIRNAGFKINFLNDNPVIHRRVTNYITFFRHNAYKATENVKSLRRQKTFVSSIHYFVFLLTIAVAFLGLFSVFSIYPRLLLVIPAFLYIVILLIYVASSAIHTHSISVALGVFLLMPTHHTSLAIGTFKGVFKRIGSSS